ncbi:MAG: tetratricopeptide repeat protein [Opitutae bacterium]|nr:tetratricopeptide repeat protein [Opitutae bacterium]
MNRYSAGHNLLHAGSFISPLLPLMILSAAYPSSPYIPNLAVIVLLWCLGLVISYGLIAIHEMGHAIAAHLVGLEFTSITIGHWRKLFSLQLNKITVTVRAAPACGYVELRLTPRSFSSPRIIAFLLAGIFFETIAVVLALLGPYLPTITSLDELLLVFGRICVICIGGLQVLVNLLPIEGLVGGYKMPTDGLQLLHLWKNRSARSAQRQLFDELTRLDELRSTQRSIEAIELASDLARQNPDNLSLLLMLGGLHAEAGDTQKAEAIWRELLKRPVVSPSARAAQLDQLCCLPLYYGRLDLLPEAEAWCTEALKYAPDAITLKGTRGSVLVELGRIDEGMALLREVIKQSECAIDRAVSSSYLAKAHAAKGDHCEARQWIEKARGIDPNHIVVKRITAQLSQQEEITTAMSSPLPKNP